ncbi:hypothetical protein K227x_04130 [Rubripirellula lacrimiformis]|uniref:Uncharacterized protein n=1 Tax=Rubripirellula lacrimiformis TaxID=1930273 RepID=A0A517N4I1_9BACT|nr:hypothetical protein [Rubripirellula lacrimiformis]QDT02042.1 hypothetical protein K227x_04130 [Rubripirellula lacrimiformis]
MSHLFQAVLALVGGMGLSQLLVAWAPAIDRGEAVQMPVYAQFLLATLSIWIIFHSVYWPLFDRYSLFGVLRQRLAPQMSRRFGDSNMPAWIFPPVRIIQARVMLAVLGTLVFLLQTFDPFDIEIAAMMIAVFSVVGLWMAYQLWRGLREVAEQVAAEEGDCLAWWQMDEELSQRCRSFFHHEIAVRLGKFIAAPVLIISLIGWLASLYHWYEGVLAWHQFGMRLMITAMGVGGIGFMVWAVWSFPNLWVLQQRFLGALFLKDRFCVAGYSVPMSFLHSRRFVRTETKDGQTDLWITIVSVSTRQFRHHNNHPFFSPEMISRRNYLIPVPPAQQAYIQKIKSAYQL